MPAPPSVSAPRSAPGGLVGAWRLVTCETRAPDGTVVHPLGPDALGSISYSADGHVAVHLSRGDRSAFAGDDLFRGTDRESEAALRSYVAYAGTYRCEGDTVVHRIELSLFPNCGG